jgi:hypothetical protein
MFYKTTILKYFMFFSKMIVVQQAQQLQEIARLGFYLEGVVIIFFLFIHVYSFKVFSIFVLVCDKKQQQT